MNPQNSNVGNLNYDPNCIAAVRDVLGEIADTSFAELPTAALKCYLDEGKKQRNTKGFRDPLGNGTTLEAWILDTRELISDRLGIPVFSRSGFQGTPGKEPRSWRIWELATPGLLKLFRKTAAEHLRHQLWQLQSQVKSFRLDLFTYQYFRCRDEISPLFVPGDGRKFVRVDFGELPLALNQASPLTN